VHPYLFVDFGGVEPRVRPRVDEILGAEARVRIQQGGLGRAKPSLNQEPERNPRAGDGRAGAATTRREIFSTAVTILAANSDPTRT
jgi:hypothetical protein